jgi:hypothetical protein
MADAMDLDVKAIEQQLHDIEDKKHKVRCAAHLGCCLRSLVHSRGPPAGGLCVFSRR